LIKLTVRRLSSVVASRIEKLSVKLVFKKLLNLVHIMLSCRLFGFINRRNLLDLLRLGLWFL